jgi:uncharacterized protein
MKHRFITIAILITLSLTGCRGGEDGLPDSYDKHEFNVPMRDGTTLYTAVYVPKDTTRAYPFLIKRSPYASSPYGSDEFPDQLGPAGSTRFQEAGYIFVYQDVRGRFMSEGTFLNMTPHADRETTAVNESTDTFDTVEWLLDNVGPNNGRAGLWGISYPGFYAAASIVDTHPAIRASSPQAPIGDWFAGDDFHHNGAFYLQDAYGFFSFFESPEDNPTDRWGERIARSDGEDAYPFFLEMGALSNAPAEYFSRPIAFWDSVSAHPDYDAFWQRRNIIPHMKNITTGVMTVAGLFDAEDPYGPIQIYQSIERNNPDAFNVLVLGPWFHGGWVRAAGDRLGNVSFGQETSTYYQESVDLPFFETLLKGEGSPDLPEALAFSTGSNAWHRLDAWPPAGMDPYSLYLGAEGALSVQAPVEEGADHFVSDPANPVRYTQLETMQRTREYMVEDQRFAGERPDVLVYQTGDLAEDVTLAGPISVDLFVSTTAQDADFVVKLIDVFPADTPEHDPPDDKYLDVPMAGYQMMVRGEVFRGRYRNGLSSPEPMTPGAVERIRFDTPHVFHTFRAGHRIMVQVQSSWFPLVDRNPQNWVDNIYLAGDDAFGAAEHTILRSAAYPSRISAGRFQPGS